MLLIIISYVLKYAVSKIRSSVALTSAYGSESGGRCSLEIDLSLSH